MILNLLIYIQCQHQLPMREVVCPSRSKADKKGVVVGLVDARIECLIFKQETGVYVPSQTN